MKKVRLRRRESIAVGSVLVAGIGAAVYFGALSSGVAPPKSGPAALVWAAFERAVRVDQSLGDPPAAYAARVAAAVHTGRPAPALTAAMRKQIFTAQRRALLTSFGASQLPQEITHLNESIAADALHNTRVLSSGISKIKILGISVAGSRASVTADLTVWTRSYARQASGSAWLYSDPVNVVRDVATLSRDRSGQWQVGSLSGNFVPGYGP